jgi:hypothetical protein
METTSFLTSFGKKISLFASRTGPLALLHVKMACTSTQEQRNVKQMWKRVSLAKYREMVGVWLMYYMFLHP